MTTLTHRFGLFVSLSVLLLCLFSGSGRADTLDDILAALNSENELLSDMLTRINNSVSYDPYQPWAPVNAQLFNFNNDFMQWRAYDFIPMVNNWTPPINTLLATYITDKEAHKVYDPWVEQAILGLSESQDNFAAVTGQDGIGEGYSNLGEIESTLHGLYHDLIVYFDDFLSGADTTYIPDEMPSDNYQPRSEEDPEIGDIDDTVSEQEQVIDAASIGARIDVQRQADDGISAIEDNQDDMTGVSSNTVSAVKAVQKKLKGTLDDLKELPIQIEEEDNYSFWFDWGDRDTPFMNAFRSAWPTEENPIDMKTAGGAFVEGCHSLMAVFWACWLIGPLYTLIVWAFHKIIDLLSF